MRRALALLVLVLASCSPERFRIVEGPASLTIGATLWTPEASAKVEAGGRVVRARAAAELLAGVCNAG